MSKKFTYQFKKGPQIKMTFELDEDQVKKYEAWLKRHDRRCGQKNSTALGGRLSFHFTPTGLGTITQVHCICGGKKDLTPDNW